jgi:hypothetical protein
MHHRSQRASPEGTTIRYDAEADRSRYFVTDSGITVVTRDYSLFENPVTGLLHQRIRFSLPEHNTLGPNIAKWPNLVA